MNPHYLYRVKYTAYLEDEIIPGTLLVNQETEEQAADLAGEILKTLDVPEPRVQAVQKVRESRLDDMMKYWTQVQLYELTT